VLHKGLCVAVVSVVVVLCAQAVVAGAGSSKIAKVFVWPAQCANVASQPEGQSLHQPHGNVYFVYADGRKEKLTDSGDCARVALSPDKRTAAWIQGPCKYQEADGAWYTNGKLVVYRDGKPLREMKGPFGDFAFRKGGAQIATAGGFGDGTCCLWDVKSGKLLAKAVMEWGQTKSSLPSWARELEVIVGD
jgi:hypothetical protein